MWVITDSSVGLKVLDSLVRIVKLVLTVMSLRIKLSKLCREK